MKMAQFWPTFGAVNLSYPVELHFRLSLSPQFCSSRLESRFTGFFGSFYRNGLCKKNI